MKKHMWARFSILTLVLLALFTWADLVHAQGVPKKSQSVPWGFFYNDPYHIPLSPGDDAWFLSDNKSEAQNRDEIALVIDPSNGAKARAVRSHLEEGGRLVILVGGYGSWGSPSEWMRPMMTYANDFLNALVLQVNYQDAFSNLYPLSFTKGVDRVTQMVLKVRKAGADKIRIYGHSQGSDITARVVAILASSVETPVQYRAPYCWCWWYGQGNPEWFEGGFGFANPAGLGVGDVTVTSAAAPPPDGNGRRGGFYRYVGNYPSENGFYYGNKFVLFNRWSDPATYGGIGDIALIGLAGHSYRGVFSYPDFMTAFEEALTQPANTFGGPWGNGAYVNLGAGEEFDFADFHSIPFIPRADEMSRCTLRVGNAAPKYPIINEVAKILVKFYDSNGGYHHKENIALAENGSYELMNPMSDGGSAEVFSSEEITVVLDYDFEDNDRYFIASYPSESYPSNKLYLPFLAKGWGYGQNDWRQTTEMVLFNPGSQDASGFIEFNNGTPGLGNFDPIYHRFSIPAKGSFRLLTIILPDAWSSPTTLGAIASAIVWSDAPLSGMVRNLIGDVEPYTGNVYRQYSESNYRAFATRGQNIMYAPLLISGRHGYESGMVVFNTSDRWLTFTVKFYAQGGGLVATSALQTLYCRDMKVLITSDFLPASFKGTGFVGSAVVELSPLSPKETLAMIPQNISPSGVTFYEGVPDGAYWYKKRSEIVDLPLIRDQRWQANTEWDSGINVVNMADGWEWIRIRYHKPNGGETLVTGWKLVSPHSSVTFWGNGELPDPVPPALFEGSGKVEGSWQKKAGATVQVLRSGKEQKTYHDLLFSYSAWW